MKKNYTHNFKLAHIKHSIEEEFYEKIGKTLDLSKTSTIVTGPDYQRHINNFKKYITNTGNVRICEIDTDIFIDIYQGCKNIPNVNVVNKSIELFGSSFIDCDLTCISDMEVIKKTLLKQIEIQLTAMHHKAFILTVGLRSSTGVPKFHNILSPIFGMLGSQCSFTNLKENSIPKGSGMGLFKKEVRFGTSKSRIQEYKCYSYNAGGGPMLTCLIIYR